MNKLIIIIIIIIVSTATKPGAVAHKTVPNKIDKYFKLASTHIFYPFAIETAGTWHKVAIELTRDWQAYHHYHRRHPGVLYRRRESLIRYRIFGE